ncbi:MAG: histidine kinase dimerization/phosphoacceptor domain -containing protein [Ignavibacteria bacterium]
MKRNIFKSTQRRIIYLVAALGLLMLCGLFYLKTTEDSRVTMLMKDEQSDNTILLQKIIDFKSEGLKTFANDYTYWDEMVQFVQNNDTAWSNANIAVSMPSYGVDYVWVFDEEYKPGYHVSGANVPPIDSEIITKEMLLKMTSGSRFFHFFIRTNSGIVEISGATIHPTADPERLTKPRGYFAAGRLWSDKLIGEISELTGSDIVLKEVNRNDSLLLHGNDANYVIYSAYTLNTWEGKPLIQALSSREVTIVKSMHEQSHRQLTFILVFVFGILLLFSVSLYYMVNLPLSKTTRSLRESDTKHILKLVKKQDEFGEMARLINDFFDQKQKLVKEIEERTEAEGKLRISEEELKHSLTEKEVLLKEVHHRVKNNLQIIISLIRLQTGKLNDENTIQHLNTTLNRIKSIAFVHEMLYRSDDLSRIDFNKYITQFTGSLQDIYSGSSRGIKLEISVSDIFLSVEKAVPCGVIINELVTNSIKHAFKGDTGGTIKISMEICGDLYILKVSDNGIGLSKNFDIDESGSLGMFLLKSLSRQIDAELEIESKNGTTVSLRFSEEGRPLPEPKKITAQQIIQFSSVAACLN